MGVVVVFMGGFIRGRRGAGSRGRRKIRTRILSLLGSDLPPGKSLISKFIVENFDYYYLFMNLAKAIGVGALGLLAVSGWTLWNNMVNKKKPPTK